MSDDSDIDDNRSDSGRSLEEPLFDSDTSIPSDTEDAGMASWGRMTVRLRRQMRLGMLLLTMETMQMRRSE